MSCWISFSWKTPGCDLRVRRWESARYSHYINPWDFSVSNLGFCWSYCWWFRNPAPVVSSLSHYLQCFIHPRWWSPDFWTINSMKGWICSSFLLLANKENESLQKHGLFWAVFIASFPAKHQSIVFLETVVWWLLVVVQSEPTEHEEPDLRIFSYPLHLVSLLMPEIRLKTTWDV